MGVRILFTVRGDTVVLLYGFTKQSQKTPKGDLQLAKDRKANYLITQLNGFEKSKKEETGGEFL